jgi:hypothetical protein
MALEMCFPAGDGVGEGACHETIRPISSSKEMLSPGVSGLLQNAGFQSRDLCLHFHGFDNRHRVSGSQDVTILNKPADQSAGDGGTDAAGVRFDCCLPCMHSAGLLKKQGIGEPDSELSAVDFNPASQNIR